MEHLQGITDFFLCFSASLAALWVFKCLYTQLTPHDEIRLIRMGNRSAALAFGGALIGFALGIASAASNSVSVADFLIWAAIALFAQLIAFRVVQGMILGGWWLKEDPKESLAARLERDELSAGIFVGSVSVAIGLLNAASMTM